MASTISASLIRSTRSPAAERQRARLIEAATTRIDCSSVSGTGDSWSSRTSSIERIISSCVGVQRRTELGAPDGLIVREKLSHTSTWVLASPR